jgi:hypothetical protein
MADQELSTAVERIAVVFARRHVQHALIGGLAVGLRSRPRSTKDADFIIQTPALAFPALLEDLAGEGFQIDVLDAVRRWSTDHFLVFWGGPVRIDWMQPVLPIYTAVLNAAVPMPWREATLRVATAEGLILTKMLAFRPQDQADIDTLLCANRQTLDLSVVRKEWATVASPEDPRTVWLEAKIAGLAPQKDS